MDFFAAQDHARRTSRLLLLWFAMAVAGLVVSVYLALAVGIGMSEGEAMQAPPSLWNPELLGLTALVVGGVILIGSTYKVLSLGRNGGAKIAEELGGRLVSRSSTDTLERRLVNIVDEMAIASGIPAPPVYVLDAEQGINAFAAGARPTEAVVAVTRGALEQLSRDELQGVIAHEFSHVLNGDMRLNLRLLGVLHGILLLTLAGRVLMRGARGSDRRAAPLIFGGLALVIVGYIGVFFGKLIKAGVSRQREYLADASAVQFTRNPTGLAGALKRIAGIGSEIQHPRAEEASHMFFGTSGAYSRLLATHPPIETRIQRLDPEFSLAADNDGNVDDAPAGSVRNEGAAFSPTAFVSTVGTVTPENVAASRTLLDSWPEDVQRAVHVADGARALLFALLAARDDGVRERQFKRIAILFGAATRDEAEHFRSWLESLPDANRLPVLDLALPTLGELPPEAKQSIIDTADFLIEADEHVSLFEYVLRRLLRASLEPRSAALARVRPAAPGAIKADASQLLALLARAGETAESGVREAYVAAAEAAPLEGLRQFDEISPTITIRGLDRILGNLATTTPAFRKALLEACATAVRHDGKVSTAQGELLRAVCQALDCPVPSFI